MAARQDLVLETSGAFERFRDTTRLWLWLTVAVACIVASIVAALNYEAIVALAAEFQGRRSGLRGAVGPATVGIPLLLAAYAAYTGLTSSVRWRDRNSGEVLQLRFHGPVFQVAAEARQVHARFSTGDPRQYLPLTFGKKGEVGFALHVTPGVRRAFVSITEGYGRGARPLPLIVLEGNAFEAIADLEGEAWQRGASPQTIASFLDPLLR